MTPGTLQTMRPTHRFLGAMEALAEAERGQLPLWMPVALGSGIAAWFLLPGQGAWVAFLLLALSVALAGMVLPWGTRTARAVAGAGMLAMLGCALIWWRAERVAAPVLARPVVVAFEGLVERVEPLPAREAVRLTLRPDAASDLPPTHPRQPVRKGCAVGTGVGGTDRAARAVDAAADRRSTGSI